MRIPSPQAKQAARYRRTAQTYSVSAPLGGWNSRDPLAKMDELDAVYLENFMPQTSDIPIRGGYVSHATGLTGNGKTLAPYNSLTGTNKLFCLTGSGVYDVTNQGAVGASLAARTNGKHQYTQFGDGTSEWLILCNGVDKPLYYDGTTWTAVDNVSTPALTGITTTNLVSPLVFKGRLMFIEKNSLSFWYLPVNVAGGALTEFDLSSQAKRGGYLIAMGTWTRDAGNGPDDFAVFVTSKGEVIVYQGTDPSSASAWAKIGTYFLGVPIGRRCLYSLGGDLLLITENGAFALSAAIQSAQIDFRSALSYKIEPSFTESARNYKNNFGWEMIHYPARNALLVNIPIAEDGEHHQYVMNTITKAWTKFTGWDAETFGLFNEELYFANGTAVYKAWSGATDNGVNINAKGKHAFNYFKRSGLKKVKLFRVMFSLDSNIPASLGVDSDFNDTAPFNEVLYQPPDIALWDVALWDVGKWGGALFTVKSWHSPAQWDGYAFAGKVSLAINNVNVRWVSSDYVFEDGGIIS